MRRRQLRLAVLAASAGWAGFAQAGGFDRLGSANVDLLFSPGDVVTEAGVVYVAPQRKLKDVERLITPSNPLPRRSDSVDVQSDFVVPWIGVKVSVFEPVDCLAAYSQPYGADAHYGKNNAYSQSTVDFEIDTNEYALTCSYKWTAGKGEARLIGGVSYQELEALLTRQSLLIFDNEGVGKFDLSDEAWSWRVGAAYEIPDIAFRASLLYTARYDYGDLAGTVDTTGFGSTAGPTVPFPLATGVFPVDASSEVPQAVDLRVQTGLAPDWLGFASIRWQDWSQLQSIAIRGVVSPIGGAVAPASFDAFYEDGWTVTAGVGHKFGEKLSGLAALTWDKGTTVDQGFQTDSYSLALGASYAPTQNVEFRLDGSLGVLTGGNSIYERGDQANAVVYSFDGDLVAAGSASLKISF